MTEQAESVRIIIEVVAGLLPGKDPDLEVHPDLGDHQQGVVRVSGVRQG